MCEASICILNFNGIGAHFINDAGVLSVHLIHDSLVLNLKILAKSCVFIPKIIGQIFHFILDLGNDYTAVSTVLTIDSLFLNLAHTGIIMGFKHTHTGAFIHDSFLFQLSLTLA